MTDASKTPVETATALSAVFNISVLRWVSWLACGFLMLLLVTQPVSVQAQAALGMISVIGLILLSYAKKTGTTRYLFLSLGSVVLLRYLYWRLTSTLPPVDDIVGLIFGLILVLAELFSAFVLAISLVVNADPLRRKALPREKELAFPQVDVFIPCFNETSDILGLTIAASKGMDYPAGKLKVWLLDDGGTDQKCNDPDPAISLAALKRRATLQALCRELGAHYLTRSRNEHAKAGNLNNGLAHSNAEIIVVFDADHAPFRQFLQETVGHFARDPKLFLVQSPHVFINPDPIERNLRTFHRMPSENEMFYAVTQRGLDKWDSSFFCGSAALMRRSALETNKGFAGVTITEDCETALELHAQGWTSLYIDKPLIAGLQPETFSSFITQRSRWCQGMLQILLLKNPVLTRGLRPIQRFAYLSSMTFWLFPLPRLIFMIAPLLYIFLNVKIFVSNVDETIAYTVSYMAVNTLMQSYLFGTVRWPWMSELYEYVQGVYLSKAIVSVVFSPRQPTFKVTAKGTALNQNHLSELALPFFLIYGTLLLGVATATWRYLYDPGVTNLMLVVGLWTMFNLIIAGVALGAVAERPQKHRHSRLAIERKGVLTVQGVTVPVRITDVSQSGCGIVVDTVPAGVDLTNGETSGRLAVTPMDGAAASLPLAVRFPRNARLDATKACGLAFLAGASKQHGSIADLMYGDAGAIQRFLHYRRTPIGILKGTALFLFWGFTEPFRAISYAFLKHVDTAPEAEVVASGNAEIVPAFDPSAFSTAVHGLASVPHVPQQPTVQLDRGAWLATLASASVPATSARASERLFMTEE